MCAVKPLSIHGISCNSGSVKKFAKSEVVIIPSSYNKTLNIMRKSHDLMLHSKVCFIGIHKILNVESLGPKIQAAMVPAT